MVKVLKGKRKKDVYNDGALFNISTLTGLLFALPHKYLLLSLPRLRNTCKSFENESVLLLASTVKGLPVPEKSNCHQSDRCLFITKAKKKDVQNVRSTVELANADATSADISFLYSRFIPRAQ